MYVKSFKDSDSSGSGDLKGVSSKLDYLKNLGVGSVYLVSVFWIKITGRWVYETTMMINGIIPRHVPILRKRKMITIFPKY